MGAESMMMQPGAPLLGGLAAVAIMDGMGVMDGGGGVGFAGVPSTQTNPAANQYPSFSDPELSALQSRIVQQHASFASIAESQLSMAASNGCALDEETRWVLAYGMKAADYYKAMAAVVAQTGHTVEAVEAVLVEGVCKNGKPEGAFTAVTRFTTSSQVSNVRTTTTDRRRVTGTMRNGKPTGELVSSNKQQSQSNMSVQLPVYNMYTVRTYKNGDPAGKEMTMAFISGGGSGPMITTTIVRHLAPNHQAVMSYTGNMPATESTMVDGQLHGWMIVHPVEYIAGHRSPGSRECYQYGQKAPASACGSPTS
ncbi:MAG: hypothetical protein C0454_10140 [Parvibaculum sp.]|nr:hypothetical protein [Parvibaculum sp.]